MLGTFQAQPSHHLPLPVLPLNPVPRERMYRSFSLTCQQAEREPLKAQLKGFLAFAARRCVAHQEALPSHSTTVRAYLGFLRTHMGQLRPSLLDFLDAEKLAAYLSFEKARRGRRPEGLCCQAQKVLDYLAEGSGLGRHIAAEASAVKEQLTKLQQQLSDQAVKTGVLAACATADPQPPLAASELNAAHHLPPQSRDAAQLESSRQRAAPPVAESYPVQHLSEAFETAQPRETLKAPQPTAMKLVQPRPTPQQRTPARLKVATPGQIAAGFRTANAPHSGSGGLPASDAGTSDSPALPRTSRQDAADVVCMVESDSDDFESDDIIIDLDD